MVLKFIQNYESKKIVQWNWKWKPWLSKEIAQFKWCVHTWGSKDVKKAKKYRDPLQWFCKQPRVSEDPLKSIQVEPSPKILRFRWLKLRQKQRGHCRRQWEVNYNNIEQKMLHVVEFGDPHVSSNRECNLLECNSMRFPHTISNSKECFYFFFNSTLIKPFKINHGISIHLC